MDEFVEFIVEG